MEKVTALGLSCPICPLWFQSSNKDSCTGARFPRALCPLGTYTRSVTPKFFVAQSVEMCVHSATQSKRSGGIQYELTKTGSAWPSAHW